MPNDDDFQSIKHLNGLEEGPLEIDMVVVDIFHGQQLLPGMNSSPRLLLSMNSAREYNIFWYTNNNIKVHEREERRRGVRNNRGQGHSS